MVVIDHKKNIQRIIDRLLDDTAVYDSGATKGKARAIVFGDQPNNLKLPNSLKPYIYVTTRDFLQTTKRDFGVINPIDNNSVEYEIVLVADSRSRTEESQKQLYDIVKNVRSNLEADPTFKHPTLANDPVFTRSIISDVSWDQQTRGKLTTSISIVLLATVGIGYTIDIAGFTGIPLQSILEREIEITEDIYSTDRIRKNSAPVSETHSIFVEMEYVESQVAQFRINKRLRIKESITLHRPSTSTAYSIRITEISNDTPVLDQIKTVTLRLEIFH